MTERLYYDDPYLAEFDAVVLEAREDEAGRIIRLDRSAVYPTSGGQPFDPGSIGECRVTDVFVDVDGEVWHRVDGKLQPGTRVHGHIDWERRRDHMQQHAGEHLLAGELFRVYHAHTIGLHLGRESSTIDCEMDRRPEEDEIREIERAVNRHIQSNDLIRQWFLADGEQPAVPFRKAPSVTEHVRAVMMGDYECCACGGTHPRSTGEIGLIKILDVRPSRGKIRFTFVCGMRAILEFQRLFDFAHRAAGMLSAAVEDLPEKVEDLSRRLSDAEREAARLARDAALLTVPAIAAGAAEYPGAGRVASGRVACDAAALRDVANAVVEKGITALLSTDEPNPKYVFLRAADSSLDVGRLLSAAAKATGGRGGGRADFAQGGGTRDLMDAALRILAGGEGGA